MTNVLDWKTRAAAAIRTADKTQIIHFLQSGDAPTTSTDFYDVLKDIASNQRSHLQNDSRNTQSAESPKDWNTAWEATLDSVVQKAKISFGEPSRSDSSDDFATATINTRETRTDVSDIFEQSLKDASLGEGDARKDGHDVAMRLWNRFACQKHLLNHGAIHLCAKYGNLVLLTNVLNGIKTSCSGDGRAVKRGVCQHDRRGEFTALGLAIYYGYSNCAKYLEHFTRFCYDADTKGCIFGEEYACDRKNTPILHFVIKAATSRAQQFAATGIQDHIRALKGMKEIVTIVTQLWPGSLLQLSNSETVYARAEQLDKTVEESCGPKRRLDFAKTVYDSIFVLLAVPHKIQDALYAGGGKVFELDLSDFNHPLNNFESFVTALEEFERPWVFEETLLYLNLPDLGRVNSSYAQIFPELFLPTTRKGQSTRSRLTGPVGSPASRTVSRFLDLLYKKGVRSIIEVKIPDDHSWPLSESVVLRKILEQFTVQKLDWRKLDLDLKALTDSRYLSANNSTAINSASAKKTKQANLGPCINFTETLEEIRMYSSGNWGTLYHWVSEDGLGKFPKLEKVHITIVEPAHLEDEQIQNSLRTSEQSSLTIYQRRINSYVTELHEKTESANFDLSVDIMQYPWADYTAQATNGTAETTDRSRLMDDLQPCRDFLETLESYKECENKSKTAVPPRLQSCFERFRDRPVRIAIIDNGIDKFRSTINPNIEDGISFTKVSMDGNKVLPWWSTSDAHGTQMAYLIRNVNPYCRLLPVRVGLSRDDIDPGLAVQAVRWAVKRKVDIISISWTTKVESHELNQAIKEAVSHPNNILVICSTADEGVHRMDKIWPADCSEVVKVSASDRLGHARPESQRDVDVLVDGDRLLAHGPSYMKNHVESPVSGSSVATAIVAGLASLCLCLARLANEKAEDADSFKDKATILELFEKMHARGRGNQKNVIMPGKLFKADFAVDEQDPRPPAALLKFKRS